MPFSYIEHASDIGILATGATLQEAFESGAQAMLNIMYDTATVERVQELPVTCEAESIPLLYIELLNELLCLHDIEGLAFREVTVEEISEEIGEDKGLYRLKGTAGGEALDAEKHCVKTEAKAATYAGLDYRVEKGQHMLRCIIDV